jgi:hypothetical protein
MPLAAISFAPSVAWNFFHNMSPWSAAITC